MARWRLGEYEAINWRAVVGRKRRGGGQGEGGGVVGEVGRSGIGF